MILPNERVNNSFISLKCHMKITDHQISSNWHQKIYFIIFQATIVFNIHHCQVERNFRWTINELSKHFVQYFEMILIDITKLSKLYGLHKRMINPEHVITPFCNSYVVYELQVWQKREWSTKKVPFPIFPINKIKLAFDKKMVKTEKVNRTYITRYIHLLM